MSAPPEPDVMIHVDQLTRVYKSAGAARPAVANLSFSVRKGEVLGFLGPNGAGKSTTMKMLTCYLPPTRGRATVAGFDVFDQPLEVRRRVGYLPEDTPLYRDMTVLAYLLFVARLRGVAAADRKRRIKEVGEVTGVLGVLGKYVSELSRGFRQRVGLTQAMLHDPPVLILDEPTSGLDPNQIVEIRELIRAVGTDKTVILSTHILPEVQATCNRVIIINDGRIVADGRPDDLIARERANKYRLLLAAQDGDQIAPRPEQARALLSDLPGVREVAVEPSETGTLQLGVVGDGTGDLRRELCKLAIAQGWPLMELDRREVSLEQVFARLTRAEPTSGERAA